MTDASPLEPEARHRLCWYGRRTPDVLPEVSYQTVEDGELLFCSHPMLLPLVGYHFDVRNCDGCDWFKPRRGAQTVVRVHQA